MVVVCVNRNGRNGYVIGCNLNGFIERNTVLKQSEGNKNGEYSRFTAAVAAATAANDNELCNDNYNSLNLFNLLHLIFGCTSTNSTKLRRFLSLNFLLDKMKSTT